MLTALERTRSILCGGALGLAILVTLAPALPAQSRFATSIVSYHQGSGTGLFDPNLLLGGPRGGGLGNGSLDILTLGAGGDVTLGFDVTITDGPGADFIVYENGFAFGTGVFAEVAFVEVSTDGVTFARFPTRYSGPDGPLGAFDALPWGAYGHLAGGTPILANVMTNSIDPTDPVEAGGDAFDLAELRRDPVVVGGAVDLSQIHFVRLVDLVGGELDTNGREIWDTGAPGSADFDAVAVIQHAGNQAPDAPRVDLWRDGRGFLHLVVEDPDGFWDLAPGTLRASVNLVEVSMSQLTEYLWTARLSTRGVHLVSAVPIGNLGVEVTLAVSVRDLAGHASADQVSLNL